MRLRLRYRRHSEVTVSITHRALTVGAGGPPVDLLPPRVRDDDHLVDPRGSLEVPLHRRDADRR
jgi:hypothetical protein